nr:zinc finger, CW-type [Tanacetum cinerariifolium]
MNGKLKQEVVTSYCGDKSKSTSNFSNDSDQKSLKVRIRVCSDDTLTRKNAENYSGLGLDGSPLSSLEASPVNSDGFFHVTRYGPDVSPISILEMMTSFLVAGSLLLSPLPYDILHLNEKKLEDGSCGPKHKGSQENTVTALHGSDSVKVEHNVLGENSKSNGLGVDGSPLSSLEASPVNSDGFFHATRDGPDVSPISILEMMTSFSVAGSLLLSPLPYDILHVNEKKLEDESCGPTHKGSQENTVTALHGSDSVKVEQNFLGENSKSKATEKNSLSMESPNGDDVQNSIDILPKKETSVGNFASGYQTSSSGGKKNQVKETCRKFFGELDLEHEDHDEMAVEKPSEGITIRKTIEDHSLPKERSNAKRSHKPPSSAGPHVPTMGN